MNYLGERRVLTALEGETLLAVAQRHRYSYVDGACGGGGAPSEKLHKQGEWVEPKYGEGASCYFCHVVVAKAFAHLLPPVRADEEEQLRQYPFKEDMTDTSRLACQISLTKACVGGAAREGGMGAVAGAGEGLGGSARARTSCPAPPPLAGARFAQPSRSPHTRNTYSTRAIRAEWTACWCLCPTARPATWCKSSASSA